MATVFEALIPIFAMDTVAIFDQNYKQLFRNARAIKAVVKEDSKIMEHPIESGASIVDHSIILPVEIDLSFVLLPQDYADVYKSVRQYFLNRALLVVQSRSAVYPNQVIASMPHEEDPMQYNTITLAVSLKQVQFVQPQYTTKPVKPSNKNTVDRGIQQPQTPTNFPSQFSNSFGKKFS